MLIGLEIRKILRTCKNAFLGVIPDKIATDSYGFKYQIESRNSLDSAVGSTNSKEVQYIHFAIGLCKKPTLDVAIDVGANKGYYSIPLSSHFKTVIAYEPVELIFQQCRRNLEINDISNVKLFNLAVSDKSGIGTLYVQTSLDNESKKNTGLSSLIQRKEYLDSTQQVRIVTLDSQVMGKVDFIKIDCEGSEYEVLLGAKQIITLYQPDVIWEASLTISEDNAFKSFYFFRDIGWSSFAILESLELTKLNNFEDLKNLNKNLNVFSTATQ
jgi:FkbM family methyltransferase